MRIRLTLAAAVAALTLTACGGGTGTSDATAPAEAAPSPEAEKEDPALGGTVHTAGADGGMLDITPSTITYTTEGTGQKAEQEVFAVVAYKAASTKGAAASETVPAGNGGWEWIAPDGEAAENSGFSAPSVTAKGFTNAGPIQSGSFQWRSQVFDIDEAQRGGTLIYTDGEGEAYRWKMPAKDEGPELAKLKAGLK